MHNVAALSILLTAARRHVAAFVNQIISLGKQLQGFQYLSREKAARGRMWRKLFCVVRPS